jgi:site-specific DNA-methyltransferase (adenine-specific)
VSACEACSRPVKQPARGRRRRFCSSACRQVAYRRRRDGEQRRRLVRLVQADARSFLPSLPDRSVDAVITDPPYAFDRGPLFKHWFEHELPDDAWPSIVAELYRVLRPDSHCYIFCDRRTQPLFSLAARAARFRVHPPLVWDKSWLGPGAGAWRSGYEFVLFLEKGARPGNTRSCSNVLRYRRPARGYPTEKPVPLLEALLEQTTSTGDLVLDPFCGSGNLGIAARNTGRRALLADVDAAFAARRLRLAIADSPAARADETRRVEVPVHGHFDSAL